ASCRRRSPASSCRPEQRGNEERDANDQGAGGRQHGRRPAPPACMSTYRKVDPSTLGWVKGEIDETLKQARVALEGFIENPSDRGRLRFCITHLHQVVGTLLMVELDGAALIAREVEALAEAVLDEQVEASPEVLETLTRGIL